MFEIVLFQMNTSGNSVKIVSRCVQLSIMSKDSPHMDQAIVFVTVLLFVIDGFIRLHTDVQNSVLGFNSLRLEKKQVSIRLLGKTPYGRRQCRTVRSSSSFGTKQGSRISRERV